MSQQHGPAMICATKVMKPGPTRIGRIGAGITLPRTVAVPTLFASGGGALVGLALALAVHSSFSSAMYGLMFGGAAGWFLVSYSPIQGESMLKWLYLRTNTARRVRKINGQRVLLAVGVAPVRRPPRGPVRIQRSAVRIPSSQYDHRGVLISPGNRNLPADGDRILAAALTRAPGAGDLTPVDGVELGRRRAPRPSPATAPAPGPGGTGTAPAVSKPRRLKD